MWYIILVKRKSDNVSTYTSLQVRSIGTLTH